jgi:hypothetical protein
MRAGLSAGARAAGTAAAPTLTHPLDAVVRDVGAGRHATLEKTIGMLWIRRTYGARGAEHARSTSRLLVAELTVAVLSCTALPTQQAWVA